MKERVGIIADTITIGDIIKDEKGNFVKFQPRKSPPSIKALKVAITRHRNWVKRYEKYSGSNGNVYVHFRYDADVLILARTYICSDNTFETDTQVINMRAFCTLYTETKQLNSKVDLFELCQSDVFKNVRIG